MTVSTDDVLTGVFFLFRQNRKKNKIKTKKIKENESRENGIGDVAGAKLYPERAVSQILLLYTMDDDTADGNRGRVLILIK